MDSEPWQYIVTHLCWESGAGLTLLGERTAGALHLDLPLSLKFYLFIFGCAGSLLLDAGFL